MRPARPEDVPWLLQQLRLFASTYPVARAVMGSDDYCGGRLGTLIAEQFVAIATTEDGQAVGFIAGALVQHPFNPELRVASELWWWVVPESRKTRAGLLLLNAYDTWANANADLAGMTLETASPVKDSTLERRGYKLVERQFIREIASTVVPLS